MSQKISAARHQHLCREAAAAVQREWHRYGKDRGTICDANGVEYSPAEQAVWRGVWAALYDDAREAWTAANPQRDMSRVPTEDVECACGLNRVSCARHQVAETCDQD